jgi:hypothetical protein
MQNTERCELCLSDEFEECYELNCCHRRYCEYCVIHLKANNLGKCYKCFIKLNFTKINVSKSIKSLQTVIKEPSNLYYEKIALE